MFGCPLPIYIYMCVCVCVSLALIHHVFASAVVFSLALSWLQIVTVSFYHRVLIKLSINKKHWNEG